MFVWASDFDPEILYMTLVQFSFGNQSMQAIGFQIWRRVKQRRGKRQMCFLFKGDLFTNDDGEMAEWALDHYTKQFADPDHV